MKNWMIIAVLTSCVSAFAGEDGPDQETRVQFLQRVERMSKKSGRPYDQKVTEARFFRMDANNDGIVTREERRAQFKEARKEEKEAAKTADPERRTLGLLAS